MSNLKLLQKEAQDFTILYVEDNLNLLQKASTFLKKFFKRVDSASDGVVALKLLKEHEYPIVITDIRMPNMDGLQLSQEIKKLYPETKVIIMSAFDEKDYLLKSIELGISHYLTKPVNAEELTKTLLKMIKEINHARHEKLFYMHLQNVFNYQSSMVAMLHDMEISIANEMFSDFFEIKENAQRQKTMIDLSANFLAHDGFLYNHNDVDVLSTLQHNPRKLFHAKLKDKSGSMRHFILKYQNIPEKDDYGVLSFDDVTELNLLKLFDSQESDSDMKMQNSKEMFDLLGVIQRNSAKVSVHNYYKGLSITNDAVISHIGEDKISIKTSYIQLKAMQIEQKFLIVSEALPKTLHCAEIIKMSFEKQEVEVSSLHFMNTSPIMRKTIRVVPDGKMSVSLFLGENKFHGEIEIEDISLDAVKLKMQALPAGLSGESDDVSLDIVLELDNKPLIINTTVKMYRKKESHHSFYIVFLFDDFSKNGLVKYITKRQMALIREIKGMQNG